MDEDEELTNDGLFGFDVLFFGGFGSVVLYGLTLVLVLVGDPLEPPAILTFTPPDKPYPPFFATVDPPDLPVPKFLIAESTPDDMDFLVTVGDLEPTFTSPYTDVLTSFMNCVYDFIRCLPSEWD